MTCPGEGTWFNSKDNKKISEANATYTFEYDNYKKGRYHCTYNDMRYNFYVQGKGE